MIIEKYQNLVVAGIGGALRWTALSTGSTEKRMPEHPSRRDCRLTVFRLCSAPVTLVYLLEMPPLWMVFQALPFGKITNTKALPAIPARQVFVQSGSLLWKA